MDDVPRLNVPDHGDGWRGLAGRWVALGSHQEVLCSDPELVCVALRLLRRIITTAFLLCMFMGVVGCHWHLHSNGSLSSRFEVTLSCLLEALPASRHRLSYITDIGIAICFVYITGRRTPLPENLLHNE